MRPQFTRARISLLLLAIFALAGCGGSKSKDSKSGGEKSGGMSAAKVPTMKVDGASWVDTNLKTSAKLINVTLKLPKGVKISENGNGGADIRLSKFYLIQVSNLAVSNLKEAMQWANSMAKSSSHKNFKKLVNAKDGFVYTHQMKDEANGKKYQPEVHFFHIVTQKDSGIFAIRSTRPMDNFSVPGNAYSEKLGRQVYQLVKSSARINK